MSARRAALAAALACNPPATGEPGPAPPVEAAPPPLSCEDPPPGTLALLPLGADTELTDRACPWVLVASGDGLTARSLGRADAAVVRASVPVTPPPDCRPCRFSGLVTAAGPLILAVRPSAGSELADAAWLGAGATAPALPPLVPGAGPPTPTEPAPLAFAPLWFGQPVFGDSTIQGPPWALAPYLCPPAALRSGAPPASPADPSASTSPAAIRHDPSAPPAAPVLVLLPEPRLPGARAEEPPAALSRAAGVYTATAGELSRQPLPAPFDMSLCTRVALELP